MTVMNDALLRGVANITTNRNAKVGNVIKGGQLGVGPHLTKIDAVTPLVFSPAVVVVTHVPTMFQTSGVKYMPELLKALVERHAKSITGIDFGYELEEQTGFIMNDGQEAKVPTKAKRTTPSPNMVFPELQGNLVWSFFTKWIKMISHPDTHYSSMAAMTNNDKLDPFVYSSFAMDIAVIQFDPTMLPENITDCTFVSCMYPKVTGNMGLQREIGTSQVLERSIDFSGIVQHNENTYAAGVEIARALGLHTANFDFAPPIQGPNDIDNTMDDGGLYGEIDQIATEFNQI